MQTLAEGQGRDEAVQVAEGSIPALVAGRGVVKLQATGRSPAPHARPDRFADAELQRLHLVCISNQFAASENVARG